MTFVALFPLGIALIAISIGLLRDVTFTKGFIALFLFYCAYVSLTTCWEVLNG
jgi:hypothetical protein